MDNKTERMLYMALRAGELQAQDLISYGFYDLPEALCGFIEQATDKYEAEEETTYRDMAFTTYAEHILLKTFPKTDVFCIYADETGLFAEDFIDRCSNLIDIAVPRHILRHWYDLRIADNYPKDAKMTYEKWLDEESTADDGDGLWAFCLNQGYQPKIYSVYP